MEYSLFLILQKYKSQNNTKVHLRLTASLEENENTWSKILS